MELVYLWVEKYKNIEKGFNFSPRFECKYDEVKNELTIDENKEYVSIFPENINVTAIVGENGSGKSSLLKVEDSIEHNIEVIYDTNRLIILSSSKKFESLYIVNKTHYKIKNKSFYDKNKIYFNWDIMKPDYGDYYKHLYGIKDENTLRLLAQTKDNIVDLGYFHTEIIKKIIQFNYQFAFKIFSYNPYYIKLTIRGKKKDFEDYKIGQTIFQLKKENNKMRLDDFYRLYYKESKEEINKMLNDKLILFHISDQKNRDFFDLSSGERTFFVTNLMLLNEIEKKDSGCIVYLDEPDITLHPDWQKKFLYELQNMLIKLKKKVHVIVTTHSPFLLSDLPKENVIFLEKYRKNDIDVKNGKQKVGNCKNVTKEIDIETFGANIHTLLSHGFFMKDGLMGEFAKEKINETIKFLNDEVSTIKDEKEAKKIIKSIGEPFLQQKLSKMFYEKFETQKQKRIKELQAELKRLKNG